MGSQLVSCCGTKRALGINVREMPRFAGDLCGPQVRQACACAAEPTRTDDNDIVMGGDSPFATCVSGACTTHIARAHLVTP